MQGTPETIWIHRSYQSQFDLLGAMASEIAQAFVAKGYDARLVDIAEEESPTEGVFVFLNTPRSIEQLPPALFVPGSNLSAVQVHVDHPFALPDSLLDQWFQRVGFEGFRLMLPCLDDVHLLRTRFSGLVHSWMPHGIPRESLCDADALTCEAFDERAFDVVVTGSVRSQEAIDQGLGQLDAPVQMMAKEIAHLMIKEVHLGYVAAVDLVMGSRGVITGSWEAQKYLWGLVIAMVNRHRRIETVQAMQGLKVGVFGSEAWQAHCTGTIEYAGEVRYAQCASAFARGRVGLAWGPTQFVHSYSERIMQAMAGGACVVADDRLLVRRDFNGAASPSGDSARLFDWANPQEARAAVDAQLGDVEGSVAMAQRGRALVEKRCLWEHRVDGMVEWLGLVGRLGVG